MGGCTLNGAQGPKIESVAQMFGLFSGEVVPQLSVWEQRLLGDPGSTIEVEQEVKAAFERGAAMVVAGMIAVALASRDLAVASERMRRDFAYPLARGRERTIRVRLLGNFFMWVSSLYCEPKRGLFRREQPNAIGSYVELAQIGIVGGVSPGLASMVARKAALCPSLELARDEMNRDGVKLDIKSVRRIANRCGEDMLKLRAKWIAQFREGRLESTGELKGKHVCVQIDGGRTKLRSALRPLTDKEIAARETQVDADGLPASDALGRSKKRPKRTFDGQWREPKLMTIFVHDEDGRMVKKSQATIDGTLLGPDHMAELIAMHLVRLGATEAASITFAADGAVWIWERIDWIVSLAKIPARVKIHQVLDCCHAVHHVHSAVKQLGLADQQRMILYRSYRQLVRNGKWRQVVDELSNMAAEDPNNAQLKTEIEYLRKHGEAGRMSYVHFRSIGIPLGSGSIESNIRRVLNQRLKSNGMFWLEDNAEIMLQMRSQVVSGRWDERLKSVHALNQQTSLSSWKWTPPTNPKSEADSKTPQISTKTLGIL